MAFLFRFPLPEGEVAMRRMERKKDEPVHCITELSITALLASAAVMCAGLWLAIFAVL